MAISASNIQNNHRGVAFQFTGDGSSTSITVPHGAYIRPRTAVVTVITGGSNYANHSGKGGFRFPGAGTAVSATAAVSSTAASVTVTTGSAVANGTQADVVVVFDQDTDQ